MLDEGPRSPADVAILYRTNAQSRVLEEHLRAARVPAQVVGAVSFFERKEVKDVVGYLRLLGNPAADSAFERIVNVPARGSARPRSSGCARRTPGGGAGCSSGPARGARRGRRARRRGRAGSCSGFVELIDGLRDVIAQGASVAETIIQVVDRSGLRREARGRR